MRDTIDMAREAGFADWLDARLISPPPFERLVALVRADEREICTNAAMSAAEEAVNFAMALEREACAKVCESRATPGTGSVAILNGAAAAIRNRGNT